MKKSCKTKIALIIIITVSVFLTPVITVGNFILLDSVPSRDIDFVPSVYIDETNAANGLYGYEVLIDYDGDRFAYLDRGLFTSKLIIINMDGERKEVKGITTPFKLKDNTVFYIKNDVLYSKGIDDGKVTVIAKNVWSFALYDKGIIFSTVFEWDKNDDLVNRVYNYSFETEEKQEICRNADDLFISGNTLYFHDDSQWTEGNIIEISLDTLSVTDSYLIYDGIIYSTMPSGDSLLFSTSDNNIERYQKSSGEVQTFEIIQSGPAINFMTFICNDTQIIYTFEHRSADGSIIYTTEEDKQHKSNGTWRIDIESGERTQLSDEIYDNLYLFGEDQLFGQKGRDIYRINIQTGYTEKITK